MAARRKRLTEVPFEGRVPKVREGDRVEVRDADGRWWPTRAGGEPRYDRVIAVDGRVPLTVPVATADGWVNVPAGAVRRRKRGTSNAPVV